MTPPLTIEELKKVCPKKVKNKITTTVVNKINNIAIDSEIRNTFRENILGYASVLASGSFRIKCYIEAVKYVSYKMMGSTNLQAYIRTFPNRYQSFLDKGISETNIASMISSYNRNKLVNLIFEQTLVPSYVLNADMFQNALNVQANLMLNAKSEKVRTDAANSLLSHLKPPENKKIELEIGINEDKTISDLRNSTIALVEAQREMIKTGTMKVIDVAESKLLIDQTE